MSVIILVRLTVKTFMKKSVKECSHPVVNFREENYVKSLFTSEAYVKAEFHYHSGTSKLSSTNTQVRQG